MRLLCAPLHSKDLAEISKTADIESQLTDFGVVSHIAVWSRVPVDARVG